MVFKLPTYTLLGATTICIGYYAVEFIKWVGTGIVGIPGQIAHVVMILVLFTLAGMAAQILCQWIADEVDKARIKKQLKKAKQEEI